MKRGRRPGTSNTLAAPLENEYGPSAFVSGEVPVNNAQKTGPKFGPRLTNLEQEMDLFQEKIDGLAYEHKVLMAEIHIVTDWIKEKFGVQLINQDSQILKFLHLTDGIKELSKSLAMPRLKAEQDIDSYQPPQQRGPPPLSRARNSTNYNQYENDYDDQYDDQYEDDTHDLKVNLRQQFLPLPCRRVQNVNQMMAMPMAPNQPMVFDQGGEDDADAMMDDMDLDQQDGFEDGDQTGLSVDGYDGEQQGEQNDGDYDEVDGDGQDGDGQDVDNEEQEQDQEDVEGQAEDDYDNEAPPPLIPAYEPVVGEQNEEDEQHDGDGAEDDASATPTANEKEEQGTADEKDAGNSTDAGAEANEEGPSRSRSRPEQKEQPSPDRSSSRTRTRIAKAPKRYRDEDQTPAQTPKSIKPKAPKISHPSTSAGVQRSVNIPQRPQAQMLQLQRKKMIVTSMAMGPGAPGIRHPQRQPTQRFNCMFPSCGKYFPTKDQLTKHHQLHKSKPAALTEADIAKLTCEYCQKIFSSTWNLKTHYRTHTGEKPYPCNYCGQRFAYNQSRELHERHNHTLERPYVCNYCGKSFCASGELGSHLGRVHQRTYAENKRQLEEMEMGAMDVYDDPGPTVRGAGKFNNKQQQQRQGQRHPAGASSQGQEDDDDYGSHFLCYD